MTATSFFNRSGAIAPQRPQKPDYLDKHAVEIPDNAFFVKEIQVFQSNDIIHRTDVIFESGIGEEYELALPEGMNKNAAQVMAFQVGMETAFSEKPFCESAEDDGVSRATLSFYESAPTEILDILFDKLRIEKDTDHHIEEQKLMSVSDFLEVRSVLQALEAHENHNAASPDFHAKID